MQWPEFDAEVLGGNYHGHGSNDLGSEIDIVPEQAAHPLLAGIEPARWHSHGSLYNTAPIAADATLLMTGTSGTETEPVTWFRTRNKARVFFSALGHPDDFRQPQFRRLLVNALFWAMDKPVPAEPPREALTRISPRRPNKVVQAVAGACNWRVDHRTPCW